MKTLFTLSMMFWAIMMAIVFLFSGCSKQETNYGALPFIEMEADTLLISEHVALCREKPESMFCENAPSIGDIQPSRS